MDIKELAKSMTREEFTRSIQETRFGDVLVLEHIIYPCPEKIGIENSTSCETDGFIACKECWLNAIKDVKFKGEGFDWEEFKNGKIAVHCDTREKAKDFLRECDKHNLKWIDGDKAIEFNPWGGYRERTTITHRHNSLSYSTKDFFTDVQIIDWEMVNVQEFTKADLEDGMIVELRNGDRYIVLGTAIHKRNAWIELEFYDDLIHKTITDLDIMAVYADINEDKYFAINLIYGDGTINSLKLIWERKQITPVCFIDAVKAFNKGKIIYCDTPNLGKFYYFGKTNRRLTDDQGRGITPREILEGIWYIEEEKNE